MNNKVYALKHDHSSHKQQGYLYTESEDDPIREGDKIFKTILPLNKERLILPKHLNTEEYLKELPDIELQDVLDGYYKLINNTFPIGFKYLVERISKESNEKITYKVLSSLFKYIPVILKNKEGFYHNGNIYVKYKKKINKFKAPNDNKFTLNLKHKVIEDRYINKLEITKCKEENIQKLFSLNPLKKMCKFKIIGFEESGRLFEYTALKRTKVDSYAEVIKIELQVEVKKSNKLENTITLLVDDKELRFLLDEVEIIYPNINGWTATKDRSIKEGLSVKIIDNRRYRSIPIGTKLVVDNIKNIGSIKYIGYKINNKTIYDRITNYKLV